MTITSIHYTTTTQTMGETTENEALRYINYLERRLAAEYSNADVRVHLDNRLSSSVLRVVDLVLHQYLSGPRKSPDNRVH